VTTARRALGRWRDLAGHRVAEALTVTDRVRLAAARSARPARAEPADRADAVLAVIAHWRPEDPRTRLGYLERCLAGILALEVEQVVAVVVTNAPGPTAQDIGARAAPVSAATGPRETLVAGWRPTRLHRHGFYLTWAHVPLLRQAAATGRFSHLLYVEDDMRFTDANLAYWLRTRKPLARHGLLPGFARFEWRDGERYAVDALHRLDPTQRRVTTEAGDFVNLANPYQALYVLDRALYATHFRFSRGRSPLRSRASEWEVRERAASGPIFDDVPPGLVSRNVVPVTAAGQLDASCLVEHMAPTYSSAAEDPFGGVPVDELFTVGEARNPRSAPSS
jgi:hypothetical protein